MSVCAGLFEKNSVMIHFVFNHGLVKRSSLALTAGGKFFLAEFLLADQ